jgi:hypothetical protein
MIAGGEIDALGGGVQTSGGVNPLERERLAVEQEKLSLEREKLALDRSKFAAEEAKRSKEIEKLDEEIRELKRPIFRKASSMAAVATISVAVIAGGLTFGTDLFKSNILSLIAERTNLKKTVAQLSAQELTLTQTRDSLKKERDALIEERHTLSANQANLIVQNHALQQQKSKLQQDVLLAPIQTRIALLSPQGPLAIGQPGGPSDEALQALTDFAVAHKSDARIVQFFEESFRQAQVRATQASLALVLFEETGQPRWKDTIRELAVGSYTLGEGWNLNEPTFLLHLMNWPGLFSKEEKIGILKELYAPFDGRQTVSTTQGKTTPNDSGVSAL